MLPADVMEKLPNSVLVKHQSKTLTGTTAEGNRIKITLRFDDECGNKHNTFAMTAEVFENHKCIMCGCLHEEIIKARPELEPFVKWHLVSTDGPMGYLENTLYHAGDRDCWGYAPGDVKSYIHVVRFNHSATFQIISKGLWEFLKKENEKTKPEYSLYVCHHPGYRDHYTLNNYTQEWSECDFKTEATARAFMKAMREESPIFEQIPDENSDGKAREFESARHSAVWEDATDEMLSLPKDELKQVLIDRLPALMEEFKNDMEKLGFKY